MVDLVAEDQKGHFGEFFHGEQRVEFGFGFGEAFVVFGVDEEYDSADFGEVVFPEAAGCGGGVRTGWVGGGGGGWGRWGGGEGREGGMRNREGGGAGKEG